MGWVKNKWGGFRSECGKFYLQQSPKKFYQVHRQGPDGWGIVKVCASAGEAKAFAEAL
jgi:hypothetical protein